MDKDLGIIYNYFFDHYKNKIIEEGIVVECGTAEGFHNPSLTLENIYNWKFYGFEADNRFFPILQQNRPKSININMALSDKNGYMSFVISAHGGNSSLHHCDIHKKELETYNAVFEDGSYFKEISIESIEWNTFTEKYNINKVDLLILDVEGHELTVLKPFTTHSILPSIIQIEYAYSDFNNEYLNIEEKENMSGILKIYKRLVSLGYDFDYVNFNNAFFSLNTFWKNKSKPNVWIGEDEEFIWRDICYYNKNKFNKLINYIK